MIEQEFIAILRKNKRLMEILDVVAELKLPNFYLAAGCVFQNVWNELDGKPVDYGLHDIDLVFYDAENIDEAFDIKLEQELSTRFNLEFDVHNEADMHLRNGRSKPYSSCEDAISNWIATVHCVGVTGTSNELEVFAPYGLEDIFSKTIRPTYAAEISQESYEKKAEKWQDRFDGLNLILFDKSQVKNELC